MVTVSTAAATAAAAAAAELPLNGLLALNSRHLAPKTVIILDMGIFGFFLAMSGLWRRQEGEGGKVGQGKDKNDTRAHPGIPERSLQQALPHRRAQDREVGPALC